MIWVGLAKQIICDFPIYLCYALEEIFRKYLQDNIGEIIDVDYIEIGQEGTIYNCG